MDIASEKKKQHAPCFFYPPVSGCSLRAWIRAGHGHLASGHCHEGVQEAGSFGGKEAIWAMKLTQVRTGPLWAQLIYWGGGDQAQKRQQQVHGEPNS